MVAAAEITLLAGETRDGFTGRECSRATCRRRGDECYECKQYKSTHTHSLSYCWTGLGSQHLQCALSARTRRRLLLASLDQGGMLVSAHRACTPMKRVSCFALSSLSLSLVPTTLPCAQTQLCSARSRCCRRSCSAAAALLAWSAGLLAPPLLLLSSLAHRPSSPLSSKVKPSNWFLVPASAEASMTESTACSFVNVGSKFATSVAPPKLGL